MTNVATNTVPNTHPTAERPRWLRWTLRALFAIIAGAVLSTPWWGPQTLARLDYFRVRKVEFDGVRFVNPSDLVARLALDSTASIWNDLDQFASRVAQHPMVLSAEVTRTLPSTVVVKIVERVPVALVADSGGLSPVDAAGRMLPIDPARKNLDVPIVATADTAILRFLDGLRADDPRMYERVIEMRRVNRREFRLELKGVSVRSMDDLTVDRLSDILPVEKSLADQNQRVVELDLRFQDQVIARTP
ncbi:MAG: FtsQ-type POTRA domain-containing protein [Phycisphaerae bacterium]|nr:FtsQ-type POTRA domain-containing protein [Gemmatimonadaceae bacterium]